MPTPEINVNASPDQGAGGIGFTVQSRDVWKILLVLFQGPVLVGCGWLITKVLDHDNRLTVIESSRFTVGDGAQLLKSDNEKHLAVLSELAKIKEAIAKPSDPPVWLTDRVATLETRMDLLQTKILAELATISADVTKARRDE